MAITALPLLRAACRRCYYKAGAAPTCPLGFTPQIPFSAADIQKIRSYFKANLDIQGKGGVVAAPDHDTGPGGDYYYAWYGIPLLLVSGKRMPL
jgi:hypothetical protein